MKERKEGRRFTVHNITFTALFVAMGVLLPQIFHMAGGADAGKIFLPMHIPVLLSGLLLGPVSGCVVGVLSPVLSCLLTGMPKLPMMPFMVLELAAYGGMAGFLAYNRRLNVYVSLIGAMAAGRVMNAAALIIATYVFHLHVSPVLSVLTSATVGAAGIIIQLVFIPAIVLACRKVVQKYVHN